MGHYLAPGRRILEKNRRERERKPSHYASPPSPLLITFIIITGLLIVLSSPIDHQLRTQIYGAYIHPKGRGGLNKLRSGSERFSEALFSIGFTGFRLWDFSKVANSGTQPSFLWNWLIWVLLFGSVIRNLGVLLLLFYSFELLLLQVSMVSIVVVG